MDGIQKRRLIPFPEVSDRCGGRSRSSVWRDERAGRMPLHVMIGGRALWYEDEIDSYLEKLPRGQLKPTLTGIQAPHAGEPSEREAAATATEAARHRG